MLEYLMPTVVANQISEGKAGSCVPRKTITAVTTKGLNAVNEAYKMFFADDKKLLPNYSYEYDRKLVSFVIPEIDLSTIVIQGELSLTRFELGLWIAFGLLYMMKEALVTMGDHKTIFDWMKAS